MTTTVTGSRESLALLEAARARMKRRWAIVLAGGEGARLRPLVRRLFGDRRPKPYAPLVGRASLLRQTLDRAALLIPPERTVVVTQAQHVKYVAPELAESPTLNVLFQPADRGTGAGVLFAAQWISRRDAEASVVVLPSDHFIKEDGVFMAHVAEVVTFVERNPEWLTLMGVQPTTPEPEYGWISPGEKVGETTAGSISRVGRFREKPDAETARSCLASGWLWNTFAFAAKVSMLIRAGRELLPALHDRLARSAAFAGTEHEAWAVRQAYALAPTCDFSRAVLQECPPFLAVSRVPHVTWSDLGRPARVLEVVRALQLRPPWLFQRKRSSAAKRRRGSAAS